MLSKKLIPLTLISLIMAIGMASVPAPQNTKPEVDRSPSDLALTRDGSMALTANATSDTVSLVDLKAGKVEAEIPVGHGPFCVAISPDGHTGVVTNRLADSVTVLSISPESKRAAVTTTIPVGDEPRGVALSPDGKSAYIALSGESTLAIVDLPTQKIRQRIPVGAEPWHLGITPDGKRLAVSCARSQDVHIFDVTTEKELSVVKLRGHNLRHVAMSPDNTFAYVPNISERGRPATKDNIDLGWVIGNRLSRINLKEEGPREAISLDPRGKAVGDVDGVAISPDGKTLALTCGGTHELLLLQYPLPFVAFGGPGDHIDPDLLADQKRFRRVPLGGRPLGVSFTPDGRSLVVSNYLSNSVQVIDAESAQITRTVPLGGPATPSLARQGEALFLDADRSHHHWYSCYSCHVEGHTNGTDFDTFNDGSYGTPKKVLSLRGVSQTGPWTWHGWQKSLRQLAHDSMVKSMQGPEPTDAELDAMLAYLATLDFKPNPNAHPTSEVAAQVKRGEAVFKAKKCDTCHAAPNYTTPNAYDVGIEESLDPYKGFNPPSLRGVYNRSPYLHTGEAQTLEEVLTEYHKPSKLTGKPDCTQTELADLVAFLKTL